MFTNEIIKHVGQNVININNYRSQYQGFQEANMNFVCDASVITSVYIKKIPNQHTTEILTQ